MEKKSFKKHLTPEQAYVKIRHYCAFQERTHIEVKTRLSGMGIGWAHANEIVSKLIEEGFLNEERFAKAFVWAESSESRVGERKKLKQSSRKKAFHHIVFRKPFARK